MVLRAYSLIDLELSVPGILGCYGPRNLGSLASRIVESWVSGDLGSYGFGAYSSGDPGLLGTWFVGSLGSRFLESYGSGVPGLRVGEFYFPRILGSVVHWVLGS